MTDPLLANRKENPKRTKKRLQRFLGVISIIGATLLTIRFLISFHLDSTAILYILIPNLIAWIIYYYIPAEAPQKWYKRYFYNVGYSLALMFGVSLILMEGYICVIMFLPIYLFGVSFGFFKCILNREKENHRLKCFYYSHSCGRSFARRSFTGY